MSGDHLSPIGSLVLAKWHDHHTEIFSFFIKLKGTVLHTNLKFSKKCVPNSYIIYLM